MIGLAALLLLGAASAASAQTTALPVGLTFSGDAGGVRDHAGVGTGFTFVLPGGSGNRYKPDLLAVDRAAGLLRLTTTAGLAYKKLNNLDNALGLQFANDGAAVKLNASVVDIRALDQPRTYQQAGLWVGPSQDTYVKLVVISSRSGQRVHMLHESAGRVVASLYGPMLELTGHAVDLRLRVEPESGVLTAAYSIDGGAATLLGTMAAAGSLIGSDSFSAGIFGSHRLATAPVANRFDFDEFGAACATDDCAPVPEPDPDFGDGTPPVGQPGGPGGSEPPGGAPPGSTVGPKLAASLRATRRVGARRLRRGLGVWVRCTLACHYELRMLVPPSAARRLGLTRERAVVTIGRSVGDARAGRTAKTVLRIARRHRWLLSAHKRVPLTVRLVATAGGNGSATKERTVVLRR